MQVVDLEIPEVKKIIPKVFYDDRGFFLESYHAPQFLHWGIPTQFVQDNHSFSCRGTLRGMHFQNNPGQEKLIRVISGEIYDVVVDIRPRSPTFKKWIGIHLDGKSHHQVYIPKGFAHGFCVLSETAHVAYKVSHVYDPQTESGFLWSDPEIGIQWPIKSPLVSERDMKARLLKEIVLEEICL